MRSRKNSLASGLGLLAFALSLPAVGQAGNLTSVEEIQEVRVLAQKGKAPHAKNRDSLLSDARRSWEWGSVSGRFITSLQGAAKKCHPAADSSLTDYLKKGAPDAYAKAIGYFAADSPDEGLAAEARQRVLDLTDTYGFHGLAGNDLSGDNQCILDLALSMPVWIETAKLLGRTPVWSEADGAVFALWLAEEVYPRVAWASRVRRNNWGAAGSAAASLIADHVAGHVSALDEAGPAIRTLTPAVAKEEHDTAQLARIENFWRGDSGCSVYGVRSHGGIPDELRRGSGGCNATYIPNEGDRALGYQTMHVESLVLHAEALRRQGDRSLYDARTSAGAPAIQLAILFVIDNPSSGGLSWPWGARSGALYLANRVYQDARLELELQAPTSSGFRGGRTLPYTVFTPPVVLPPIIL